MVQDDRFIAWLQNEYMKSGYVFSMDFAEYYSRYGAYWAQKWNDGHAQRY